jgi:aarF domain-containing kinase
MPYLSRRLLTDNNPRMKAALRKLLYGNGTRLDITRMQKMIGSMSTFSTAAAQSGRLASGAHACVCVCVCVCVLVCVCESVY